MRIATLNISYPSSNWWQVLRYLFHKRKLVARLPENWEEVPRRKLKKVFSILLERQRLGDKVTRIRLLRALLSWKAKLFFSINSDDILEKAEPCVEWMLKSPLAVPVLPVLWVGWRRWRLPAPEAKDMSLGQYLNIEEELARLRIDPDPASLVATILRPDTEETIHTIEITGLLPNASRAVRRMWTQKFARMDAAYQYYVINYWLAQVESLHAEYPYFFKKDKEPRPTKKKIDWESIPAQIAETGVFGTVDQVQRVPVRMYLAWANSHAQDKAQPEESLQDIIRANHNKFLS